MDEFKNIAPRLSKIKKENPFKVPYNYFDDFSARLQEKIKHEDSVKKPDPFIRFLKPAISIAASIAVIFMLVYWPLAKNNNRLLSDSVVNYSEYNLENEIIGLMEDLDDNSLFTLFESDVEEDQISDDELIAYLSTNLSYYDIHIESEK
ncbi:MAG: hypothetical protein JXR31_08870 [Prolixibacteraceae bacterium]|nr:hypothetical protein [Prolixibacteraceae bacterium]